MYVELFGKATGYCKGRWGFDAYHQHGSGKPGANEILGGGIPIVVGAGMAIKQKKGGRWCYVFQ
jgi:acetoin:2,6-dichlorophenolindophenol oxidoreductase subunit alpha